MRWKGEAGWGREDRTTRCGGGGKAGTFFFFGDDVSATDLGREKDQGSREGKEQQKAL